MKRKTMELFGKTFTVLENGKKPTNTIWNYDTIYDAYGKPSHKKVNAYLEWKKWLYDDVVDYCRACDMWIESRNVYMFTLTGYIELDEITYGFHITPTRNEIWACD